ncbi:MAG: efflux RND transporter periplasmic adaptor subunit [Planctomycetia bacterium]|nr:efflux RND transporter periplasmic adaptor subunit [Planctomycetia bacterium]
MSNTANSGRQLGRRVISNHFIQIHCHRGGWSTWATVIALIGVTAPLAAWKVLPEFFSSETAPNVLTAEVTQGPFINRVLEQGEIESSSSVEVRCEVRSRNSSGTNILEIVPEGTRVKEGDFLVRLDDSALKTELTQQQITCSGSESQSIEAEAALSNAELALNEYEQGTFREQEETLEGALKVANENLRRAEEYLTFSRKLAERGYVSDVQLEADKFAVEKAEKELDVAQTKLEVLRTFTKKKMLTQLKADIQTSRAKQDAKQKTWQLDKQRLKEIEEQTIKCVIHAPASGQVVYANDANRGRSNGEMLIAEGTPVRERQLLIRLPDPSKMRVLAKVHESRINQVRKGLTAEVSTDAIPDHSLVGLVSMVSEYPIPSPSVYTAHIKEYAVEIEIQNPPPALRPGMSAQVDILVEHQESQLQIPIDATIARGDKYFVVIPREDGTFETREIKVGHANDASITVREGLEVGQKIVLNHNEIKDKLNLPELKLTTPPVAASTEIGKPNSSPVMTSDRRETSVTSTKK